MEITYSHRKKVLSTNKVGSMIGIDIVKDVKMAEIPPESMCNTIFESRSRIELTQSRFKLNTYNDSKRE